MLDGNFILLLEVLVHQGNFLQKVSPKPGISHVKGILNAHYIRKLMTANVQEHFHDNRQDEHSTNKIKWHAHANPTQSTCTYSLNLWICSQLLSTRRKVEDIATHSTTKLGSQPCLAFPTVMQHTCMDDKHKDESVHRYEQEKTMWRKGQASKDMELNAS